MNYDNILNVLFDRIPEIKDIYNVKEQEGLIDDETGKHIIFGLVIVPFIIDLVNKKAETTLIKQIFDFLEEMSFCEDVKVREILDFTILEQFIDLGRKQLDILKDFMLKNTLSSCLEIEQYFVVN